MKSDISAELYDRACQVIPDGVSSSMRKNVRPVLFFERADGPYFYDVDGNRYIDYTLAWGPLIAGSNHAAINSAVADQLTKGYTLGAQHKLEIELAETLTGVLPGVEQVLFCNTGSEAVQGAIRLARARTGRQKIVKFEGHYHGWLNNVLVSYKPSEGQLGNPAPGTGGQPASEYEDTLVLPWNDSDKLEEAFAKYPDQIACVITEPILANSGSCMPVEGFLEKVISLCRDNGAVSVFDEVITGFRIALGGAREYFGLKPDLSVYAKAIAGGFTAAAIGGRREIFDVLRERTTIHAGTYNGAPVNLAAALATVRVLSAPGQYEKLLSYGNSLKDHFTTEAARYGIKLVTSGVGSVFSVHFGLDKAPLDYADTLQTDMQLYERFRLGMLEEGVLLLPDGRWYTGIAHTAEELDKTRQAITNVLKSLVPALRS